MYREDREANVTDDPGRLHFSEHICSLRAWSKIL